MADIDEARLRAEGERLKAFLTDTVVEPVAEGALSPEARSLIAEQLASRHHLEGVVTTADGWTVVAFQLEHGHQAFEVTQPGFIPYGWETVLGFGFTISVLSKAGFIARAWLAGTAPELRLLEARRMRALFYNGRRFVSAFDVDWNAPLPARLFDNLVEAARPQIGHVDVPAAHYWDLLAEETWERVLSASDRARAQWAVAYRTIVKHAGEELRDGLRGLAPEACDQMGAPWPSILDGLVDAADVITEGLRRMEREYERDRCVATLRGCFKTPAEVQTATQSVVSPLFWLLLDGPRATRCGLELPGVTGSGVVEAIPLDLVAIEAGAGFLEYWGRLPPSSFRLHWTRCLTGTDVHASPQDVSDGLVSVNRTADARQAWSTAIDLLADAVAHRQWTIPRGARVQLDFGPIVFADLYEFEKDVVFICRLADESYIAIDVEPEASYCMVELPFDPTSWEEDDMRRVEATLAVLVCSIVRDFWVTEDRSSAFARHAQQPRLRGPGKAVPDNVGPLVVYLPRIRYASEPRLENHFRPRNPSSHRAHSVAAHLRRSQRASAQQLYFAQLHGVNVPDGFTFVRPHRRGEKERDVVYRSRSALRSLYELRDVPSDDLPQHLDWFGFENRVAQVLSARGLVVDEMRLLPESGTGVRMVMLGGADAVVLVHARLQHRTGPTHVDALVADLGSVPAGTTGLLITSGLPSHAATRLAAGAGIEIVRC